MNPASMVRFVAEVIRPFVFGGGLFGMMAGCGGASDEKKGDITPWVSREGGVADTPTNDFFNRFDPKKSFQLKFEGRGKDGVVKLCAVYSAKGLPGKIDSVDGKTVFDTQARWISFPQVPGAVKAAAAYNEVAMMPVTGTIYSGDTGLVLGGTSVVTVLLHPLQSDGKCLATYDSGQRKITDVRTYTLDPSRFEGPRELRIESNGKPVPICSEGRCPWTTPTGDLPYSLWLSLIQKPLEPGTRPDAGPDSGGETTDSGVSDAGP